MQHDHLSWELTAMVWIVKFFSCLSVFISLSIRLWLESDLPSLIRYRPTASPKSQPVCKKQAYHTKRMKQMSVKIINVIPSHDSVQYELRVPSVLEEYRILRVYWADSTTVQHLYTDPQSTELTPPATDAPHQRMPPY